MKWRAPGRTLLPDGGIAQLVERQLCKLDVRGSSPLASTLGLVAQLVELTLDKRAVTGSSPVWPTNYTDLVRKFRNNLLVRIAHPPGERSENKGTTSPPRLTGLPVHSWCKPELPGSLTSASRKKERYRVRERHPGFIFRNTEGGNKLQQKHAK